jgi:hypothetical protein
MYNNMNKGLRIVMWIGFCILFVLAFGWLTMSLWNWLVPALFNGPTLSFYQALGLLLLCKILFGGWGRQWGGSHKGHWKHRYYQKMSSMSAKDRERFKAKIWEKWCPAEKNASPTKTDTSND